MSGKWFVGVDVGGTKIAAGGKQAGKPAELTAKVVVPNEVDEGPEHGVRTIAGAVDQLLGSLDISRSDVSAVGLITPGPIDRKAGKLLDPGNMKAWHGFLIQQAVSEALGLPVVFNNDANGAALGEACQGGGRDAESLVLFTVGTGIGFGIVLLGKVWNGRTDCVEGGHIKLVIPMPGGLKPRKCPCGQFGCIEAYAGTDGIIAQVEEELAGEVETAIRDPWGGTERPDRVKLLFETAKAGDTFSMGMVDRVAYYLAVGAANVIHTIDPQVVLYAGGVTEAEIDIVAAIKKHLWTPELTFECLWESTRVERAVLGENAGWVGSCWLAETESE